MTSSLHTEDQFLGKVKTLKASIDGNKFWDKNEVKLLQEFLENLNERIKYIESNMVNKTPTSRRIYKIYKNEVWLFADRQSFYDFSFRFKLNEGTDYEFAEEGVTLGICSSDDYTPFFNGTGYVDVATPDLINYPSVRYATRPLTTFFQSEYPVNGWWEYVTNFKLSGQYCSLFPPLLPDTAQTNQNFQWLNCIPSVRTGMNGTIEFKNEGDNKVWFYEGEHKPSGYKGLVCKMTQKDDLISITVPATFENPKTFYTFPEFKYFRIGKEPTEPVPLPPRYLCVFVKFLRDLDLQ